MQSLILSHHHSSKNSLKIFLFVKIETERKIPKIDEIISPVLNQNLGLKIKALSFLYINRLIDLLNSFI